MQDVQVLHPTCQGVLFETDSTWSQCTRLNTPKVYSVGHLVFIASLFMFDTLYVSQYLPRSSQYVYDLQHGLAPLRGAGD